MRQIFFLIIFWVAAYNAHAQCPEISDDFRREFLNLHHLRDSLEIGRNNDVPGLRIQIAIDKQTLTCLKQAQSLFEILLLLQNNRMDGICHAEQTASPEEVGLCDTLKQIEKEWGDEIRKRDALFFERVARFGNSQLVVLPLVDEKTGAPHFFVTLRKSIGDYSLEDILIISYVYNGEWEHARMVSEKTEALKKVAASAWQCYAYELELQELSPQRLR